jgi:predicted transcriptional regulator
MKLSEVLEQTGLKLMTTLEEKEVSGVFISDMLSDVMTNAKPGDLWLSVQTHKNTVSAANLVDVAAIVVTHGKEIPEDTIQLANRFHVNIASSDMPTFELVRKLVNMGIGV